MGSAQGSRFCTFCLGAISNSPASGSPCDVQGILNAMSHCRQSVDQRTAPMYVTSTLGCARVRRHRDVSLRSTDGEPTVLDPVALRKADARRWIANWRARSGITRADPQSPGLMSSLASVDVICNPEGMCHENRKTSNNGSTPRAATGTASTPSSPSRANVVALMSTDAVSLMSMDVVCDPSGLCDEEVKPHTAPAAAVSAAAIAASTVPPPPRPTIVLPQANLALMSQDPDVMCDPITGLCDEEKPDKVAPPAPVLAAGEVAAPPAEGDPLADAKEYVQLWTGLASLLVSDYALKEAFKAAGIQFPAPLIGMFIVVAFLWGVGEKRAQKISMFYVPTLHWVAKWLPLFYVASLVTLPYALKGIAGDELAKVFGILLFGMAATLLFTAFTAVWIRALVKTENKEVVKAKPSSPFLASHSFSWGVVALACLAVTSLSPTNLAVHAAMPFCLACTVGGYLLGNAVPKAFHAFLHPVVVTAVVANAGAALYGKLVDVSYDQAQKIYYSKGAGPMGAGDLLMMFLGPVIISMGFRIYAQRETMKRHAPEIIGATLLSSLFSMFSTAFVAKALGLASPLARALIPRSVTVPLALPIGVQLEAPLGIVAAGVLLQGLLGANFGPSLMSALGIRDTIARGLSAAATAGGLGTASLTSNEPEALPFCALAYSMVGILSTCLIAVPQVRAVLISIVG